MGRKSLAVLGLLALAGCYGTVPNDVSEGVGFGDYTAYNQARAADARAAATPPPVPQTPQPTTAIAATSLPAANPAPTTTATASASTPDPLTRRASAAIAEVEATQTASAPTTPAPLPPVALPPVAPVSTNNAQMSDEQDFEAVSSRESIESDAERRARMQDQLVIVQPTAVPRRPAGIGPNIIDYALSTSHPLGQQVYRRMPFRQSRHEANCLAYRSPDLAQEAFLENGGPERDRQALDPDGDGYACGWDPTVYRNAARAARGT